MRIPEEYRGQIMEDDAPPWVVQHQPPPPPENGRGSADSVLLIDSQRNLETGTRYHRNVRHLSNLTSVQFGSRLEIEFSPQKENLVIHTVFIRRNEENIDLRPNQDIRVLNREARMEHFVFDGRVLVVLTLNDVRVGDIVDYSFSVQEVEEPLFPQRGGRLLLKGNFASKSVQSRLLYRPERAIYAQPYGDQLQPELTYTADGLVDCRWTVENVTPIKAEKDAPIWSVPLSWIDYGEFATWDAVAVALSPLYASSLHPLPPALVGWLEQLRSASLSEEDFIQQIIRYVQEDIRYVSVSIDDHALKPYDVATIFERGYGDCKDKSILLCRLLKEAGFQAVPALVNSVWRHRSMQFLPTPHAFDHVIVRLGCSGKEYWIDPTCITQGGKLARRTVPSFGVALVLDSPGESRVEMAAVSPDIISYDEFIKVHQTDGMAELRITRSLSGPSADHMRNSLSTLGLSELDRLLVTEYQGLYRDASIYSPAEYEDDNNENCIRLVHTFLLGGIWGKADVRGVMNRGHFQVHGLKPVLRLPENDQRTMPYTHWHPVHLRASMEIRMATGLKMDRKQGTLQSEAFRCKFHSETTGNSFRTAFEYISLSDHVSPRHLNNHAQAIRQLAQLALINAQVSQQKVSRGFVSPPRRPRM